MKKRILLIIIAIMVLSTVVRTGIITFTFLNFANTTIMNEASLIKEILTEVSDKEKLLEVIKNSRHIVDINILNKKIKTDSLIYDKTHKHFIIETPFGENQMLEIVFSTRDYYQQLINIILQLTAIAVISLIVIIFIVNYFLTPYLEILENVKRSTNRILKGDFNERLNTKLKGEARNFVESYNTFLQKLKDSFGVIEEKYTSLIEKEKSNDPLNDAKETIEQLANIFKFKRLIEDDKNCEDVFHRLVDVLNGFGLNDYVILGIDNNERKIEVVYKNTDICCNILENFLDCRAYRTKNIVNSVQYPKICKMHQCKNDYVCIPFSARGNFTGILKININNNEESLNKNLPYIKTYLKELSAIIEAKYTLELLHNQTIKDPLTDTFNRRYLENILPMIISNAKRRNGKIGFLMIDLDHFKHVNDTYGHKAGDRVLKVIAKIIHNSIRQSDILIRYGGEEFLVIIQNVTDAEDIKKVAEKIRETIENTDIDIGEEKIRKTASIGVCIFPDYCEDGEDCIKKADVSLYKAKDSGRNRVVVYKHNLI